MARMWWRLGIDGIFKLLSFPKPGVVGRYDNTMYSYSVPSPIDCYKIPTLKKGSGGSADNKVI